jgi:hypothetical protein
MISFVKLMIQLTVNLIRIIQIVKKCHFGVTPLHAG